MSVTLSLVNVDEHVSQVWHSNTYYSDEVNYGQCEAEAAAFLEAFLEGDLLRREARAAHDALTWLHDGTWTLDDRVREGDGWCFGEWEIRVTVYANV